ncbi:MaoC/PaaZ C-terminal domain-containing protein [Cupriavidus malaysiensis]|uniref:Oxidoreductase n=1 Tax=Cupriavidus malaysiensis TaxID=367825 RepID=A0ABN4TPB1_9BURK|nr:MaoC/PaaZ C-terminal domain-containing protein [Cupriavidus malaysiensis]AOZ06848.1 oxidoreductase [Cupriavidus malaysiensis]
MNASRPRVLAQEDFDRFAVLSRDDNPIHCDPAFARATHFGATVAHGMLLFSLLCAQIRRSIPRPVLPIAQTLMFPRPTFVGDGVTAALVLQDAPGPGRIALDTSIRCVQRGRERITNAEEQVTAHGAAMLLADATADLLAMMRPAPLDQDGMARVPAVDASLYHLSIGQEASAARTFGVDDTDEYVSLTDDSNPFYTDPVFARSRGFDGAIVPLPLLAGMFSDLLGTRLPGRGTGWMKQSLRLCSAARLGEPLTASVRVTRLRADKELVNLATVVSGGDGRVVLQGEALVLVRNLENKGARGAV